ncbi:hypothetical protein [Cohnella luojiensis]|nr:hypothetical protein [Cohnella luojiensis]
MNKLWYLSQISIFEEMSREEMRGIDQLDTIHAENCSPLAFSQEEIYSES